jgi:hypothetical protein
MTSHELIDDGVEGVNARLAWLTAKPVGGGQDPSRVGRPVAGGEAQFDGLAGSIEPDEMHPRR